MRRKIKALKSEINLINSEDGKNASEDICNSTSLIPNASKDLHDYAKNDTITSELFNVKTKHKTNASEDLNTQDTILETV